MYKYLYIILLSFVSIELYGNNTVYDTPNCDLKTFFSQKNTKYIIRYKHTYDGKILVPTNSTIHFSKGSIKAEIEFDKTLLTGKVNIKGSTIYGTLANDEIVATWLCYADGKNDDSKNINSLIRVANRTIRFPKGTYRLKSIHKGKYELPRDYHIGINKSNITLIGEKKACFETASDAGILCIYSRPNDIKNSVHDIEIKGLTFKTINNNTTFIKTQEHLHTIHTIGVNNLTISNCNISNFWGDGICLGHYGDNEQTGERARNQNVTIKNNYIDGVNHINRNGISVINGQNVTIDGNHIVNTSDDSMPGAIDVEANNTAYTIDNIVIKNNTIERCNGGVGAISIVSNKNRAPAHNITITGNTIKKSKMGLFFMVMTDAVVDDITVENNTVDKTTAPYRFYGSGSTNKWTIKNNHFQKSTKNKIGGSMKIKNLNQADNEIIMESAFFDSNYTIISLLILLLILGNLWLKKSNYFGN